MAEQKDYYEVLGIAKTATSAEINRAYLKISAKYHPDRMLDASEEEKKAGEAIFIAATKAKEVLMDGAKRQAYDAGGHAAIERLANGNTGTNPGSFITPNTVRVPRDLSDEGLKKFFKAPASGGFVPKPATTPAPSTGDSSGRRSGVESMAERRARRQAGGGRTSADNETASPNVPPQVSTPVAADTTAQNTVAQASAALDKVSGLSAEALASLPVSVLQQLSQKLDAAKTKTGAAVIRANNKGAPGP